MPAQLPGQKGLLLAALVVSVLDWDASPFGKGVLPRATGTGVLEAMLYEPELSWLADGTPEPPLLPESCPLLLPESCPPLLPEYWPPLLPDSCPLLLPVFWPPLLSDSWPLLLPLQGSTHACRHHLIYSAKCPTESIDGHLEEAGPAAESPPSLPLLSAGTAPPAIVPNLEPLMPPCSVPKALPAPMGSTSWSMLRPLNSSRAPWARSAVTSSCP